MARIRTIKPEFWDSPSTAKASPWSRLLFIALWNWADDHGRGTANLKELEGFAFPHDDQFTDSSGNTVHFRDLVAEVSACFGVVFYEVENRPYYMIPTWEEHQRNERRSKQSKHPSPQVSDGVAEIPCNVAEIPRSSGPGTGEQGNRGTGESEKSDSSAEEPRRDLEEILDYLDKRIEDNNLKKPNRVKSNTDAARRLIDLDKHTVAEVKRIIDYAQSTEFWIPNIRSMSKLRDKWDTLSAQAGFTKPGGQQAFDPWNTKGPF